MYTKENKWTQEEEELLNLDMYHTALSRHPLMVANGRTAAAIRKKRQRARLNASKPPKAPKSERAAIANVMKGKPYTAEQKALLLSSEHTNHELAAMPIFQDRTYLAIRTYRNKAMAAKKIVEEEVPKVRIRVKPSNIPVHKPRPLYQFIKTSEATPARVKVWQAEERAMQTF